MKVSTVVAMSFFSDFDIELFKAGKHFKLYEKFGAHLCDFEGQEGCYFSVWAPNAGHISVIGTFNEWKKKKHILLPRWDKSGIWEGFIPGVKKGESYKFHIVNKFNGIALDKADPYAFNAEQPPSTASRVWKAKTEYKWSDKKWLESRGASHTWQSPVSVYEVHLGSWMKPDRQEEVWYSYEDLIDKLVPYVKKMGFTHIEMMPVMEHPYFPSWGYQITGYYAATSRYGDPDGLKKLINAFHKAEIGVILDWVPSHFPSDGHGLNYFDGTHLYEHADPQKGYHPDWKSMIFDYGRPEVKAFLISNALFWLEEFHADGLRVDAVASMVYLDYSRDEGFWTPNKYGGREYLEAIEFVKECNDAIKKFFPETLIIAEESTAFPKVTGTVKEGSLGYDQKWMMGWMHDTLEYFQTDPLFRKFSHNKITFSMVYANSEHYMLPLSHDEVVHGKKSLLNKMPGNQEEKFANLRLLFGHMYCHPGSKLLFMGGEIGQYIEWAFKQDLDWKLLEFPLHQGIQNTVIALNKLYRKEKALYEYQYHPDGFEWLVADDGNNSILVYKRRAEDPSDYLITAINFTPVYRESYKVAIKADSKKYKIVFNSNDAQFGGSADEHPAAVKTGEEKGSKYIDFKLPPLGMVVIKPV